MKIRPSKHTRGLRETKGVSSFRAIVGGEVTEGTRIAVDVKEGELVVEVEQAAKTEAEEKEAAKV